MSGSGENAAAADDDTGVANPENNENNEDNDVPNISDADTEPAMLEEEEMPTYMSLTSSSRPDESRVELEVPANHDDDPPTTKGKDTRAPSPCASDDQGGGSIYVVSSGEESYQAYNDEDYESDEMELEDEEEEEDEDDSRRAYNDDEEDSDGDIEPEQFERSSDDFVLRYDTNLEKHHKTRSRSLQDLTTSRGNLSRFVGKRRSVDMMGHYDSQLASREREPLRDPLGDVKKSSKSSRYADVPSKVKLYIQSIKEQNRKSSEHKNRQNPLHKNFNDARTVIPEVSCTRINPANRMIKGYAQNVINAIMEQNNSEKPEVTYGGFRLGENAPEKDPIAVPEAKKIVEKNAEIEQVPDNSTNAPTNLVKNSKSNGIIDFSTQNNSEKMVEPMETCATNGQEQVAAILNLRSVTYEEYANGDEASNKNEIDEITRLEEEAKNGLTELMEQEEILSVKITETRRLPAQKIEIVKVANPANEESRTVRETSEIDKSSSDETPNRENPDVAMLWTMLNEKSAKYNEKSAQYDGIREAFQKTLTENISLKRELEELKKTLAQCKTENKPRETKAVSVQTENVLVTEETKIFNDSKISTNDSKPPMPKLLSSSIGSALSSIEQWSDSNCSPAISINPPNMDHVLNSDDSLLIPDSRTPRRQPRQMSKSFITSSRILQTLANITQGRTRTASPLASAARNVESRLLETEKGQSMRESNISIVGNETKARKRKASDMLGFSNNPETFKIPRTPEISRKKINSDSDADAAPLKSPWVQSRTESTPGGSKDDDNTDRIPDDLDDTEATDVPDNVKCFVYQEEADCKERSFLIQAEEPTKSNDGGEKGGGAVRECGPYLLGNCEIRMSEANGTINIWGKEISQESEYVDVEEEMEEETDPLVENPSQSRRGSLDGQKTPRARFVNGSHNFVCSTNKKSKTSPSIVKSSIGKYFRPALSNLARANSMTNEGETVCNDNSPNNQTTGCETCDLQKKRCYHCPNCDHLSNSRRKHSCCRQDAEFNEKECDCARTSRGALDDDVIFELLTNILANHKKCNAAFNKHSCANHANDETCKHQTSRIRPSPDGDCHHAKKRCSSCADDYLPSCNTRLTPRNSNCCDRRSRSHSLASSCDDEEHPLLNGHYETPETKRRRLSGKKVRGILTDLLRGCGGCRDPSNASFVAKETSSLPNIIPTVRVTPCTPTQPSCSKSSTNCAASHPKHPIPRDAGNENCSSCSRRVEMAAEIESKLELLTVEMERLRSRSDTFRGMLNLLNADTD